MNKNLKLFFTLSVLLNVLLIGISGGMAMHRPGGPRWDAVQEGLSPETRQKMAQEFQQAHKDIRPLADKAKAAREEIVKALSNEQFNEQEFDGAITGLQKAQRDIMDYKIAATKRIAAELPVEERKKLADHFARSFGGKFGDWNKGGKHDQPPKPEASHE